MIDNETPDDERTEDETDCGCGECVTKEEVEEIVDDRIGELREENEELRNEQEEKDRKIDNLERRLDANSKRFENLLEVVFGDDSGLGWYEVDEDGVLLDRIDDLDTETSRLDNISISALQNSQENRKAIEERDVDAFCDEYAGVPDYELSWAEQFHHKGRDAVESYRKRDVHARMLFNALPDRGWKDNKGNIILPTASNLTNRLDLEYSELYRACEALAERSNEKIEFVESHRKIGKHLRIDSDMKNEVALDLSGVSGPPSRNNESQRMVLAAT